jgi:mannose-6-phosphate isomerase-like protein (cupin superfamily)
MKKEPTVIKFNDVEKMPIPFGGKEGDAGWWRQIITPERVDTKGFEFGDAEVNPGYAAHAWHNHEVDHKVNKGMGIDCTIDYPETGGEYTFEEFYRLISGSGVVQWETEDGKIHERQVTAGDMIWFPRDVCKHQFLNTGREKAYLLWGGGPLPKVTIKQIKK